MADESRIAVLAAMAGNGALAAVKGAAAVTTGSAAMLAETFHSLADTGNQILLFLGMRLARRPPDAAHPFGHGKDVYFWSFVVSIMLFTLGGAFAVWEAVRTFLHPHPHESFFWSYVVLAAAAVFETASFAVGVHQTRRAMGARSLREYWRAMRDPTLATVIFEDTAALVSLGIAAGGLALVQHTGSSVWDGVASAVIGTLLIGVAIVLAFESHSLLIGESAPDDVERTIRGVAETDAAVERVLALHTMHLGPDRVLAVLRIEFRPTLAARDVAAAVDRIQDAIVRATPTTTPHLVVIEPGRGGEVAPAARALVRR